MNINKHQQRGMGGLTIMFLIVIFILALIVFFKLFPVYMESWKVVDALESIAEDEKVFNKTDRDIQRIILRELSEKDIELFDAQNIKEHVTIERISDDELVEVTMTYQQEKLFVGNIFFLLKFKERVELP
ncbi:DUF4845 domain-containing protein [Candidatus Marithioploca araucensis]|uniref:DUF4845 domain-containing protein n=1 Tax=Candidatus Marithioploca araucensis TaxID=70273 RepID=A0ABT7VQ82_9GAMM|nr:DUF4845 domain-containing protein [Candidatus Marithioploca araucensis]